jgi:antitoxin (DNA-binding transcriptional repressor) of toxin-antitoxin stability system
MEIVYYCWRVRVYLVKIASAGNVKTNFSNYLQDCQEGPVIVAKNGRTVAVLIVATTDDELERLVLAHTPKFRRMLGAADQRIQQTGGIKHEDFWKSIEASK